MNLQNLRAKLSRVERERNKLEQQIKSGSKKQLEALPGRVGLKTIDELILELLPYASPRIKAKIVTNGSGVSAAPRRGRPPKNANGSEAAPAASGAKSKGTRYSPELKESIKKALEEGGMTVSQISEQYGASPFSINQWKKSWGLTKARRKK
jgi:hypothetical protein